MDRKAKTQMIGIGRVRYSNNIPIGGNAEFLAIHDTPTPHLQSANPVGYDQPAAGRWIKMALPLRETYSRSPFFPDEGTTTHHTLRA